MSTAREQLQDEFERGESWNPRKNEGNPNPLYGTGVKWTQAATDYGMADFLTVRDDDGKLWSILVGNFRLKKDLKEGEISVWNEADQKFDVVETRGPVRPGEVIAIQYIGEEQFRNRAGIMVTSSKFRVARREAAPEASKEDAFATMEAAIAAEQQAQPEPAAVAAEPTEKDDGIPW